MLALTQQILTEKGNQLIAKLRDNIMNVKTGNYIPRAERQKMADSLHFEIDEKEFRLFGGQWIFTYESGRGPTVNPGDGAVRRNVLAYLQEEGIQSSYKTKAGKDIDQGTLAYFISKKIHEKGTALFRENRKSGVLSEVINFESPEMKGMLDALFYEFEAIVTSKLLE